MCVQHGALRFCGRLYCTTEMKTDSMVETQTSDIVICRSAGGRPRPAGQLTTSAYQAEHGIPSTDA